MLSAAYARLISAIYAVNIQLILRILTNLITAKQQFKCFFSTYGDESNLLRSQIVTLEKEESDSLRPQFATSNSKAENLIHNTKM